MARFQTYELPNIRTHKLNKLEGGNSVGSGVSSFNGREGVVTPEPGDYSVQDVTGLVDMLITHAEQIDDTDNEVSELISRVNMADNAIMHLQEEKEDKTRVYQIDDIPNLQTRLVEVEMLANENETDIYALEALTQDLLARVVALEGA